LKTRSSAIAEGPRDASCQLKSCQLPRTTAETTCTTSPEEIEVISPQYRNCSRDPDRAPVREDFSIDRVELAVINQCTKYEVSRFIRYEAMNGGSKCRKWGGLRCLGGTQGHGQCHHSIERIRLPIRLQ